PRTGKKILVIDDTEMLLIFVEEILATADETLQIATASSGVVGLATAAEFNPDLILLDYSLPDLTGDQICARLLEDEKTAGIPVVMMSGHVPEMTAVAERFENVVDAIAKPFLSTALIELVDQTLSNLPALVAAARRKKRTSPPTPPPPAQRKPPGSNGADKIPTATLPTEPIPPALAETHEQTAPLEPPSPLPAATEVPATAQSAVVLRLQLEVVSLQFSPALRMNAIRARPASPLVSLHLLPQAQPGAVVPEATFELVQATLNLRGHIDMLRLAPTNRNASFVEPVRSVPVASLVALSAEPSTLELTAPPVSPLRIQLFALFELAGVELSPHFGVGHLLLRSRGGKMRVGFHPESAHVGRSFENAQVLLDRAGRITELLLDALA
ncbi:MAG TPA: response regulator, partial [Chthoniobacterales bacterium]